MTCLYHVNYVNNVKVFLAIKTKTRLEVLVHGQNK